MSSTDQAILIVERDDPTRELYLRELGRSYHVLVCADEHDALDLLHTHDISAVVLEPALTDERGWGLLTAMKQAADTQAIPVILCSTLDERRRGLELGAAAYLVKPVLPTTLLEVVRRITGQAE
jgi:DNA-binding response OmpR family regulator